MILKILSKSDKSCFCASFFHWGKSSDKHLSLLKYYKRPQLFIVPYFNFNISPAFLSIPSGARYLHYNRISSGDIILGK